MPKPAGNRKKLKGSTVKSSTAKPKAKGSKGTAKPNLTAGQLFDRAQQAIAFERYDAAIECMRDALQLEPENVEILDAYGALLAELGSVEEAVEVCPVALELLWMKLHAGQSCRLGLGCCLAAAAAAMAARAGHTMWHA